jgi:hypothetical protein
MPPRCIRRGRATSQGAETQTRMAYLGSSLRLMIAAARYPSRGDGWPALTRSNLPAGSGNGRAEWDSGQLRRYLGHTALSRPLKKKLLYWIFPASRAGAAGGRRHGVFQQRNTYTGGTDHLSGAASPKPKVRKTRKPPSTKIGWHDNIIQGNRSC